MPTSLPFLSTGMRFGGLEPGKGVDVSIYRHCLDTGDRKHIGRGSSPATLSIALFLKTTYEGVLAHV